MFAMSFPWAHFDLARTCLSYLLMPELSVGVRSTLNELEEILAKFPLLEYAAKNWVKHVEMGVFEAELLPLILQLLTPYSNLHFLLWLQVVMCSPLPGVCIIPGNDRVRPQPLYYAASYGLIGTVEALIAAGADVNVRAGRYGGTALHAAYYRDHPEVVEVLLQAGADPTIRDLHGDTPLELVDFDAIKVAM
jgi:Ankyrin repeats (3 copies)